MNHDWKGQYEGPGDTSALSSGPTSAAARLPPRLTSEQRRELALNSPPLNARFDGNRRRGYYCGVRCASWPWRIASLTIDMACIQFMAFTFIWMTMYAPLISFWEPTPWLAYAISLGTLVFYMVESARDDTPEWGAPFQTPGKRLLGLQLVRPLKDHDGDIYCESLTAGQMLIRTAFHFLDYIFVVGWLRPLWERDRQTFADGLSHTVVLRPQGRNYVNVRPPYSTAGRPAI